MLVNQPHSVAKESPPARRWHDMPLLPCYHRERSRFRIGGLSDALEAGTYASGGVIGREAVAGLDNGAGKMGLGAPGGVPFGKDASEPGRGRIGRSCRFALSARDGRPRFLGISGTVGRGLGFQDDTGLGRIGTCDGGGG
jgi:hypothetical protein